MLIREDEILKGTEQGKTLKEIYKEEHDKFKEAIKEQTKQDKQFKQNKSRQLMPLKWGKGGIKMDYKEIFGEELATQIEGVIAEKNINLILDDKEKTLIDFHCVDT